jgi:hypothetical protein
MGSLRAFVTVSFLPATPTLISRPEEARELGNAGRDAWRSGGLPQEE